jgi:hypothetical protein
MSHGEEKNVQTSKTFFQYMERNFRLQDRNNDRWYEVADKIKIKVFLRYKR